MANRTCSVDGCTRQSAVRGFCTACYQRLRSRGELQTLPPREPAPCSVLGCSERARVKGLCGRHYENRRHHGHVIPICEWPLIGRLAHIGWDETNRGCWEWRGRRNDLGYAVMKSRGKQVRVHRVMWEMHNGPIPDGLVVRHKCDNPPCVNPNHLEIGSHLDNMEDMKTRGRSRSYATGRYDGVCANGLHDVSSPGSLKYVTTKSKSYFTCVECDRARKEKWEEARRGKPSAA